MGTNITLEPGERVSLSFIVTLDIASGESCFSHLDLVIGQTSSFPIYENIKQVSKITTFKFSFVRGVIGFNAVTLTALEEGYFSFPDKHLCGNSWYARSWQDYIGTSR